MIIIYGHHTTPWRQSGNSPGLSWAPWWLPGAAGTSCHGRRLGGKMTQKLLDPALLLRVAKATLTISAACTQKLASTQDPDLVEQHHALHQTVRTPTVETVWGRYLKARHIWMDLLWAPFMS